MKSWKKPKKTFQVGFSLIIVLILFSVLVGFGIIVYSLGKKNYYHYISNSIPSSSPTKTLDTSPMIPLDPAQDKGLIVIKKGVSGEDYVRQIAKQKKWAFLAVETTNYEEVQQTVSREYDKSPFEYLMLVGTNDEIPYAVYYDDAQLYMTDPSLYGDVDKDGLIDLAVGRLPFSSLEKLQKYYENLVPKGDVITFENYPFVVEKDDPSDSMLVLDYNYANSCVVPLRSSFRAFRMSQPEEFVKHYFESAIVELRTHGSDSGISLTTQIGKWPPIFTFDGFRKPDGELSYFNNRPIIVHMSCNNAKVLGVQMIENGASAFLGFYNLSGYAPMATQQLLAGQSVGIAMRDMNNSLILRLIEPLYYDTLLKDFTRNQLINVTGLNTFDIADRSIIQTVPKDTYGFLLYGDPSLKLPSTLRENSTVLTEYKDHSLIIKALPPKKFKASPNSDILCYVGSQLSDPSFVYNDIWNNNHRLFLTFPVKGVNKLLSASLFIDDQKVEEKIDSFNLSLIKGKNIDYIIGFIDDYQNTPDEQMKLDYTKELKVVIDYE